MKMNFWRRGILEKRLIKCGGMEISDSIVLINPRDSFNLHLRINYPQENFVRRLISGKVWIFQVENPMTMQNGCLLKITA